MADGQTANFHWTLPENHVNTNLWGGQNNANWQDADTKVYANQQNVAAILGQTSTAIVSNVQVARTASIQAQVTFTNSTAPAGQQTRWLLSENTTAEAAGNAGSDFGLYSYSNTGAFLRTNILIARSTGAMSFTGTASFSSTLSCGAAMACKSSVGVTAASTSDNALVAFANSAGASQGFIGWVNSGDILSFNATGGASIGLTTSIALNGNVTGSGTASFTDVTATNVTANSITAIQGNMTVKRGGSTNANLFLNDNASNRSAFFFDTATNQTIMEDLVSGAQLTLDGVGNFHFQSGTSNAYKPGGGSWLSPSDARIKDVTGEFELGLNEVLQLRPVTYRYKGNTKEAPRTDKQFVGFVAQELEEVMPDMVSRRKGIVDGLEVDDLRDVDVSSLVFALVNCVKQLKAEIEALKAG